MARKDTLSRMKGYQIAGMAALTSTIAAVAVLVTVRHTIRRWAARIIDREQPHVRQPGTVTPEMVNEPAPNHFSETIVIPGVTESGSEIADQDAAGQRPPEGV